MAQREIGGDPYALLGVRRVINAQGNQTVLGGSIISEGVRRAMDEAADSYVGMEELLERSGEYIAETLGVEAAYVTSGCAAALVLSTAACIAGMDPAKMAMLPRTAGMRNRIVIQRGHRNPYDRSFTAPGGVLVEAGDESGCTPEQLGAALDGDTVALAHLVRPDMPALSAADWDASGVSLQDAAEIAHRHGVPVIADAASQMLPLDHFRETAQAADLACFGTKYISAPNSTGFVCGRKDLVEAVSAHGFIGFETGGGHAVGRPMKLDRQEIVGVVAAMDAWFSADHGARLAAYESRLTDFARTLDGLPHVTTKIAHNYPLWGTVLYLVFDAGALGKSAPEIAEELHRGEPRIMLLAEGPDTLPVHLHTLNEGEEQVLGESLRKALSG